MNKIQITTEVTKEAHELGVAVKSILKGIAKSKDDDDKVSAIEVLGIIKGSWSDLVAAVDGIKNIPEEAKQEPMALVRAITIPITEAVEELIK